MPEAEAPWPAGLVSERQQHDLAIWKFQRIMMGSRIVLVHLPEDRSFVFDALTPWGQGAFSPNLVCKGQLRPGQKADS
jgi:hypothetical protein